MKELIRPRKGISSTRVSQLLLYRKFLQTLFDVKNMGRYTGKTCRLSSMLVLTTTYFLVEIIVGYVTNSMALVADSFHMLSDVIALVIGLFSVRVRKL